MANQQVTQNQQIAQQKVDNQQIIIVDNNSYGAGGFGGVPNYGMPAYGGVPDYGIPIDWSHFSSNRC